MKMISHRSSQEPNFRLRTRIWTIVILLVASKVKANFEKAFLIKADFTNAFLMEANLQGAYLTGSDFSNANLYKADFRGAKGLTIEALAEARTLYLAQFDEEILQLIQNDHPELVGR